MHQAANVVYAFKAHLKQCANGHARTGAGCTIDGNRLACIQSFVELGMAWVGVALDHHQRDVMRAFGFARLFQFRDIANVDDVDFTCFGQVDR